MEQHKQRGKRTQQQEAPARSAESQKDDLPTCTASSRRPAAQVSLSLLEHAQLLKHRHHPHLLLLPAPNLWLDTRSKENLKSRK